MPDRYTVVQCNVSRHGNYWTMSVMVYPEVGKTIDAPFAPNHWARVFSWSNQIIQGAGQEEWTTSGAKLSLRAKLSAQILQPMVNNLLRGAAEVEGHGRFFPPNSVVAAFSTVRLQPSFVGLTEPPTDRRPYTVISISPLAMKSEHYLRQVVLHEVLHVVVASTGGPPHNEDFELLAEAMGLEEEYRD
jgi:hypothetical protein